MRGTTTCLIGFFLIAVCACSDDETSTPSSHDLSLGDANEDTLAVDAGDDSIDDELIPTDMSVEIVDAAAEADVPQVPCLPGEPPERPTDYQADMTFPVGPYLMHTTTLSAVVMWESAEVGVGVVEYGTTDALGERALEDRPNLVHELQLSGLEPDTRYAYRVLVGDVISEIHHFATAPPTGSAIRFTVWGDSRTLPENAALVVDSMADFGPYLNVHVGDVVSDGRVREQWAEEYFEPMRALAHEIPSYVAIGNHERDSRNFYEYVSYPHPEDDPQHESYYSFTYGNTFFLIIDTNKIYFPVLEYYPPQAAWIVEQVASPEAQSATWRLAFAHHPAYSEGWSPGDCSYDGTPLVREHLAPLLAEHDFHVFFAGHTHDYERGIWDGLVHIITGGGGAPLDEWCVDLEQITVYASVFQHMRVEATCDTLRVDAIDVDGNPIDHILLASDQPGVLVEDVLD